MVVLQSAKIPERVAQRAVPKLFQTKDRTKFTNIIGVSLRTIKIFRSCTFKRIYHLENDRSKG